MELKKEEQEGERILRSRELSTFPKAHRWSCWDDQDIAGQWKKTECILRKSALIFSILISSWKLSPAFILSLFCALSFLSTKY